ncbi:unnamed protein product [Discosporangium mesarthrocarpum]
MSLRDHKAVRLAIVGPDADELGVLVAEQYGCKAVSIAELMVGRRGRKTDKVMAKVASERLAEIDATGEGWVLTGFPATVAQAESLEEQGVEFCKLVCVHDPEQFSGGDNRGDPRELLESGDWEVDSEGQPVLTAEQEEEYMRSTDYLVEVYEDRLFELMHNDDREALCHSLMKLLDDETGEAIGSGERGGGDLQAALMNGVGSGHERKQGGQPSAVEIYPSDKGHGDNERGTKSGGATLSSEENRRRALEGALSKRQEKERIRTKKREANEAQRMDTPFYIAVAEKTSRARVMAPVKAVPSRITGETLGSRGAVGDLEDQILEFGPLVLRNPAAACLVSAGITRPTGIQQAGMEPIRDGESVILHAMTGSGKTLAFLLPLLQRLSLDRPWQLVLALPTRELAVQVAREAVLLSGGDTSVIELLVGSSSLPTLEDVKAPIVVGAAKMLERSIRKAHPKIRQTVLDSVECIVVDEVDRLVDTLPKYTSPKEVEKRKKHARPITALLERLVAHKPDFQVVACSATIGRPLRRELAQVLQREGGLRVIRDEGETEKVDLARNQHRVTAVVAHLQRVVSPNTMALHEAMGFGSGEDQHGMEALLQHDRLAAGHFGGGGGGKMQQVREAVGAGGGGGGGPAAAPPVLVTSEDSARGLHFNDVDYVFMMKRPRNPDEYVHLAGRTGRLGKEGNVVSLMSSVEVKKLQGWETSLDIQLQELSIPSSGQLSSTAPG